MPLALLLLAAGCGTVATVRPLPKGASSLSLTAGGPVARYSGTTFPAAYPVVRYRYGLADRTTLHAGLHPLMAALGVVGVDAGASWYPVRQSGPLPSLGLGGGTVVFIEPGGESRLFPQLELAASYMVQRRVLVYFGCQGLFQLNPEPLAVPTPFVGSEVRIGSRFSLSLETKWYAASEGMSSRREYYPLPIAGRGALGFALGASYGFRGWYE